MDNIEQFTVQDNFVKEVKRVIKSVCNSEGEGGGFDVGKSGCNSAGEGRGFAAVKVTISQVVAL